jgi:hypothetical protein
VVCGCISVFPRIDLGLSEEVVQLRRAQLGVVAQDLLDRDLLLGPQLPVDRGAQLSEHHRWRDYHELAGRVLPPDRSGSSATNAAKWRSMSRRR